MGRTIVCVPYGSEQMDLGEAVWTDRYEWNNRSFTPDYGSKTTWDSTNSVTNWLRNYDSNKITKDINPNWSQGMSDSSYGSMFIRSRNSSSDDCLAKKHKRQQMCNGKWWYFSLFLFRGNRTIF